LTDKNSAWGAETTVLALYSGSHLFEDLSLPHSPLPHVYPSVPCVAVALSFALGCDAVRL